MSGLTAKQREARLWFYGIVVASFIPIVILAFAAEHVDLRLLVVATVACGLLVIGFEALLIWARTRTGTFRTSSSLKQLIFDLGGLPKFFTGARSIEVLAGVGDELRDEATLRAMAARPDSQVRILLFYPGKTGARAEMEARKMRAESDIREDVVESEIIGNLPRIAQGLGARTARTLRLYTIARPFSLYRADHRVIIGMNSFGHGSSAPGIYLEIDARSKDFFEKLLERFDEVWSYAERVNQQGLPQPRELPQAPAPLRPARPEESAG